MNSNIANGGLALKVNEGRIFTDIAGFSGTFLVDDSGRRSKFADGLLWFMNSDDQYIYYSDQTRNHNLCRIYLADHSIQDLLDIPCYGLTLLGDYLYFIDEKDQNLYRCLKSGSSLERLVSDRLYGFAVADPVIWCATENGHLKTFNINTKAETRVLDQSAIGLVTHEDYVIFADKAQDYVLTIYSTRDGSVSTIGEIQATSINAQGPYLYCVNKKDNMSIYRVGLQDHSVIRICGSRSDYLHILDTGIYFIKDKSKGWYSLPLSGGQQTKVIND